MDLLNLCLERGLLAYMAGTFGQVVRFIPPLIVTAEQVDQALHILDEALSIISHRS
jgi:4-aminobutyrate aminotransferase-like enzyme